MQPQGDSIWGNINLCIEIALNIYYLCGEKGEGIVIQKEQAEKDFSPETVAAGKESDGYLYYPKGEAMEMFRQEMLQKRLVMIKKMELAATEQMEAVRKGGQEAALARFQDIEPPGDREENKKRIWNGIYILNGEEPQIAVHERIAEAFLTPYACEFGRQQNIVRMPAPLGCLPLHLICILHSFTMIPYRSSGKRDWKWGLPCWRNVRNCG